jgi:hypothetical protein
VAGSTPVFVAVKNFGAFVGMSTFKILNKYNGYIYAGIFRGFVLASLNGIILVGGKYGFSAFISVNLVNMI